MRLTRIHIMNFKTFSDETISFGKLNILIGSNASGKSNTVSVCRFLNQIMEYGIENAISLSGGMEYVLNTSIGKSKPLYISFSIDCEDEGWVRSIYSKKDARLLFAGFDYEFEITPHKRGSGFAITQDHISLRYYEIPEEAETDTVKVHSDRYYIVDYKKSGKRIVSSHEDTTKITDETARKRLDNDIDADFFIRYMNDAGHMKELILNYASFLLPPFFRASNFIRIFDFDTKAMKKASMLTSINRLNEDGSNLASVLQELLKTRNERRKLENLLSDCLPFVESISTEKNFDKSISYKIKESYSNKPLYANFLSDGTVNILAIIVALYFDKNAGIIILEEPERNLHPYLMSRLLDMASEQSEGKQIIITTHTPELIKHSDVETLLLANRCENGFTHIARPADSAMVKEFLKNEVGIDSLFVQNLLEV